MAQVYEFDKLNFETVKGKSGIFMEDCDQLYTLLACEDGYLWRWVRGDWSLWHFKIEDIQRAN